MNIVSSLIVLLVGFALLSGVIAFRPRYGIEPDQRGIAPLWTASFAWFTSLAIACVPGVLVALVSNAIVLNVSNPSKVAHWQDILAPFAFLVGLVPATIFLLNSAFPFKEVVTANAGVLAPLWRRWRSRYLTEGAHRILWFIGVIPVDMTKRVSAVITFEETSQDKTKMSGDGTIEWKVWDPDEFLDITEANIEAGYKSRFLSQARDFIRARTDDTLILDQDTRKTLARIIRDELVEFARQFICPNQVNPENADDRLVVKILRLDPPVEETNAAARAKAETQEQARKKIAMDGFTARMQTFMAANPNVAPTELAAMFQRYEGLVDTDEMLIRGLEGNTDPGVRAMAAAMMNRSMDNSNHHHK